MKRLVTLCSALALALVGGLPAVAAPGAPSSVVVVDNSAPETAIAAASIKVTWKAGTNAVTYNISATDSANVTKSTSQACAVTNCSAVLPGLVGGTSYTVKVTAVASDGSIAAAPTVKFTAVSVPGAPTAVAATSVAGKASLTWAANDNLGGQPLTGYVITEKDNKVAAQTVDSSTTTLTVDNVSVGSSYVFKVAAKNANGTSLTADFTSVTITGVPSAPAAPTAKASGSTLTIGWVAPADNGSAITGYKVYLVDAQGLDVGTPTLTDQLAATLSNVTAGTYKIQIVAKNANGDSARSAFSSPVTIGVGTQANSPVFTPNSLTAMDIGATQSLSILAPSSGDVTVVLTSTPSGACTYSGGIITAVSSGSCTITATVPGNATYAAGTASRTVTVKSPQTITFATIAEQQLPGPFTLTANATSGLSIRFSVTGSCTVVNRVVTFSSVGTCNVTAAQPGNSAYSAAVSITRSFSIVAAAAPAGGGGGGGGGGGPAPSPTDGGVPVVKPTPAPTKTPTPTPTVPVVKLADSVAVSTSLGNAAVSVISGAKITTAITLGKSVAAKLTSIPVGTKVTASLKNAKGQVFALPTSTVGKSKTYTSSAIKPKVRGTYTVTVSYGKVKKTLVIVVK